MGGTTDGSCVPRVAGIEVNVKLDNCRKKAREDVPVPVPVPVFAVYKEQLSFTDMVTEIPKYCDVKTGLCQERRKVWVLSKIRKTFRKFYFWKTSYAWQITASVFKQMELKTRGK